MDTTSFTAFVSFPRAFLAWLTGASDRPAQPTELDMLQAILPSVVDSIRCYA